jgi:glycerate kinase
MVKHYVRERQTFLESTSLFMPLQKLKILVAPSSFKESMTSTIASKAIEEGILKLLPNTIIWKTPLADGGTGTVDSFLTAKKGKHIFLEVNDPLGRKVKASYGLLLKKKTRTTAIIEMASSSGLVLLSPLERNPMLASSYGCGELINHALKNKAKKIILGLGDTATVDGGIGLLQALGAKILDLNGNEVGKGGRALKEIAYLDVTALREKFLGVKLLIATDVDNPLLGKKGAAEVFSRQKGATEEMVLDLEEGLKNWSRVLSKNLKIKDISNLSGMGAAGGVALGLVSILGAKIVSGSKLLFNIHKLKEKISCADLIFTGEGSIDKQTLHGKLPALLAKNAKKAKVPLIAFAGRIAIKRKKLSKKGFSAVLPIVDKVMSETDAYLAGSELLKLATSRTLQTLLLGRSFYIKNKI